MWKSVVISDKQGNYVGRVPRGTWMSGQVSSFGKDNDMGPTRPKPPFPPPPPKPAPASDGLTFQSWWEDNHPHSHGCRITAASSSQEKRERQGLPICASSILEKHALAGTRTASLSSRQLFACSGPNPSMAASEVEAVLEFLRKNGFLEAESALREDLAEKGELGSFDFEKFVFPMVPPPRPLRIPARPEDAVAGDGEGSTAGASSHDQFMSLGSSTSDVCSSSGELPFTFCCYVI